MNPETKKGLKIAGLLVGGCVAIVGLVEGADRLGDELSETRDINAYHIHVREHSGFWGDEATFDWKYDTKAWIRFGNNTQLYVLRTPCDKEALLGVSHDTELSPEEANAGLEEACEILDCDGICSEWRRVSGEQ